MRGIERFQFGEEDPLGFRTGQQLDDIGLQPDDCFAVGDAAKAEPLRGSELIAKRDDFLARLYRAIGFGFGE